MPATTDYELLSAELRHEIVLGIKAARSATNNSLIKEVIDYSFNPNRTFYQSVMAGASYLASGGTDKKVLSDIVTFAEAMNLGWTMIDDIIDDHKVRMGKASTKEKYGQNETILSGLYVIQYGYSRIGQHSTQHLAKVVNVFSGWVEKDIQTGKDIHGCEMALRNIVSSYSAFCRIASDFAHADLSVQTSLENYVSNLAYALAIFYEILDLKGEFGRSKAEEMHSGDDVLIVVAAKILDGIDVTQDENPWDRLENTKAIDYVRKQIAENILAAKKELDCIQDNNGKKLLQCIVEMAEKNTLSL